jgi:putative glutamine amidotransferase
MHHQAIGEVASNLKVVARASDGVIEGVEGKEQDPLLLGVQWHPEEMASENQLMANLFEELVNECRKKDKVEA